MMKSALIGKKVIVRTTGAGVHIGTLVAKEGAEVRLENAYRLWRWVGAFTLSQVAESGVKDGSRVGVVTPEIELTDACEVITITDEAFNTLENYVERV